MEVGRACQPQLCTARSWSPCYVDNHINPNGDELSLTGRPRPSTTQTANNDQDLTVNNRASDSRPPSQRGDRSRSTVEPNAFTGSQFLTPQQSLPPLGAVNLRQTLDFIPNSFTPTVNPVNHFESGALNHIPAIDHFDDQQSHQRTTGNLPWPTAVSYGDTFARQRNPTSIPNTF